MLALLLAALPALAAPSWSQVKAHSAWELFKTADSDVAADVKLYQATIAGTKCFKADATVSGIEPETMLAVAADVEGAMRWSSAGIKDAVTLKKTNTEMDYYQYLSVPLVSDRFWFLHGTFVREGDLIGLRWEKAWDGGGPYSTTWQEVVAAHPKAVEPPVNVGAWLFKGTDSVDVTYLVCTDAGGAIPANLQSMATKGTLPKTVDDLLKEAKRR
ncbi:MAG: hypothetical protein H6742_07860 [Alphaproteobacteria bacterium]|nr:hypothetical protein [Alphaproteobacteria bacterium]